MQKSSSVTFGSVKGTAIAIKKIGADWETAQVLPTFSSPPAPPSLSSSAYSSSNYYSFSSSSFFSSSASSFNHHHHHHPRSTLAPGEHLVRRFSLNSNMVRTADSSLISDERTGCRSNHVRT